MNSSYLRISLLSLVVILSACKKEVVPVKLYEVPADIQPYVDLFEQEAAKRGKNITIDNLRVLYEGDLVNGTAAGTCTYPHIDDPIPTVRFDTTSVNWSNNEYSREILVFHELGHCVLDRREHRDDVLPNGNYSSIMRSTGAQVYGGSLNSFKREYYLDELFDSSAPAPEWSKVMPDYAGLSYGDAIFTDEFLDNRNFWNTGNSEKTTSKITDGYFHFQSKDENTAFFTTKSIGLDGSVDFEIETKLRIPEGENSVMIQWGGSSGSNLNFLGMTPDKSLFIGNWETGVSVTREILSINPREFVKLTIRKTGDFYYLYVEESYFDVLEYSELAGDLIAFYVGANTTLHVDWVRVKEIL